jgi:hypothetical protein
VAEDRRVDKFRDWPEVRRYDPKDFPYPREPEWERKWEEAAGRDRSRDIATARCCRRDYPLSPPGRGLG